MSALLSNSYFLIPVFGITVFIFSYFVSDRILQYLYQKSLGSRKEVIEIMDKMMVNVDKNRITLIMLLSSFGIGVVVFLLFWPNLVAGLIFGSAVTIFGWSLPKLIMTHLWEKRNARLVGQMVDGLTIMSNGIKSGLGIAQTMDRVTENIKGPLSQEFRLVLNKMSLGMSLEEALVELNDRVDKQDVQMLVTSINILKETGGNLGETFETIVSTIRDRQKIEKKIEAMTAQGVMQGIIMTMVPFLLLGVLSIIDPDYIAPLFSTALGWFFLFLVVVLQIIGGYMIKKVITIKV